MYKSPKQQSGAVLAISLIMLLLLTLIGITGTQTSSLEEKMAGNMRDKDLAFQAAESALAAAEASLSAPPAFDDAGSDGFYAESSTIPTASAILTDAFWTSNPVATSSINSLSNEIPPPVYIIQKLGSTCLAPPCSFTTYRITVRATGRSPDTVVILQSVYNL
jgi:type IV pilus assembly protein PilX